jgi:hypothetical protein
MPPVRAALPDEDFDGEQRLGGAGMLPVQLFDRFDDLGVVGLKATGPSRIL